eukprot:04411.XXX_102913_101662_1 [CDS] Oithona nana genome sequencing.
MTSSTTNIFFLLCVCLLIRDFSDCCTDSELVRGCRIATSQLSATFQCLCGVGCHKEFPFKTRLECETSLKEGNGHVLNAKLDPCLSNPCLNRGECIQLRFGRYKCECTGTNYYGDSCEKECPPRLGANAFGVSEEPPDFPLDCLII